MASLPGCARAAPALFLLLEVLPVCTAPIPAWPAPPGAPNRRIVFSSARSYSGAQAFLVPCGKCADCKFARAGDWAVRCVHESQMHEAASWVTFTFADAFLPDDLSVRPEALQRLNKLLRHRFGPFRFFGCGENGERFGRPHYHVIYFGLHFADRVAVRKAPSGGLLYRSPALEEVWGQGEALIGDVTLQSAAYTARYSAKKHGEDGGEFVHPLSGELCKVARPFLQMSRAPGIGSSWFDRYAGDVFPSDFLMVGGRKCRVPSYYLAKLGEVERLSVKADRRAAAELRAADNTERRLMVRHEIGAARFDRMARELDA